MSFIHCHQEGRVAKITIDREKALNALNQDVLLELRNQLIRLEGVSVVVLTGAGEKSFVAGADIKAMSSMDPLQAAAFAELGQGVVQMLEQAPYVSIAMVNGFALGGGLELALACDLIYASDNARFAAPEINLGIIPGFGGTVNLGKRIGFHRATEMILRGHQIKADLAKEYGLCLEVFSKEELEGQVMKIAKEISEKGTYSLMTARKLSRVASLENQDRAIYLERQSFSGLFASCEPKEGMNAFIEKRAPRFHADK